MTCLRKPNLSKSIAIRLQCRTQCNSIAIGKLSDSCLTKKNRKSLSGILKIFYQCFSCILEISSEKHQLFKTYVKRTWNCRCRIPIVLSIILMCFCRRNQKWSWKHVVIFQTNIFKDISYDDQPFVKAQQGGFRLLGTTFLNLMKAFFVAKYLKRVFFITKVLQILIHYPLIFGK